MDRERLLKIKEVVHRSKIEVEDMRKELDAVKKENEKLQELLVKKEKQIKSKPYEPVNGYDLRYALRPVNLMIFINVVATVIIVWIALYGFGYL